MDFSNMSLYSNFTCEYIYRCTMNVLSSRFFLSDENTFFELDGSDGHGSSSARPAVQQPPNKQLRLLQFSSMQRTNAGCCMSTAQGSSSFFFFSDAPFIFIPLFLFSFFFNCIQQMFCDQILEGKANDCKNIHRPQLTKRQRQSTTSAVGTISLYTGSEISLYLKP